MQHFVTIVGPHNLQQLLAVNYTYLSCANLRSGGGGGWKGKGRGGVVKR